jgi:aminoglycoside 6'-N-acetyltransferase
LRKLKQTDNTLLQKWLTDKRVLNYWEGQSAIFDPERIKSDFYTEEEGLTRAIIEHNGKAIGYCQMYPLDKESQKEYNYQSSKDIVYGVDQFIGEPDYWGQGIGTAFMKLLLDYLINIKNAETVIALADFSKFGVRAVCNVCDIDDVDILITDEKAPEDLIKHAQKKGVKVIIAKL